MVNTIQLVKILRTSKSLDEIAEAANTLAQSDNLNNHQELYRMARGKRRKFLSWYNKSHVIIGQVALAETGTPEARIFLEEQLQKQLKRLGEQPRGHPDFGNYPNIYERELEELARDREEYNKRRNEIYDFFNPLLKKL